MKKLLLTLSITALCSTTLKPQTLPCNDLDQKATEELHRYGYGRIAMGLLSEKTKLQMYHAHNKDKDACKQGKNSSSNCFVLADLMEKAAQSCSDKTVAAHLKKETDTIRSKYSEAEYFDYEIAKKMSTLNRTWYGSLGIKILSGLSATGLVPRASEVPGIIDTQDIEGRIKECAENKDTGSDCKQLLADLKLLEGYEKESSFKRHMTARSKQIKSMRQLD